MSSASNELEVDAQKRSDSFEDVERGQVVAATAQPKMEVPADAAIDHNVVHWDGPNDPENPMNLSKVRKGGIVVAVGLLRFVTPLASSMMASAVVQIRDEFKTSLLVTFSISIYIMGFGIGSLVLAPLSEIYGRNWIYHGGNIAFTILTAACGAAPNAGALFAFRLLAGMAGGAPMTNAAGTVADIIPVYSRGLIMSYFTLSILIGPEIGPAAGGFLAQAEGWRWIFWVLTIVSGTTTIFSFIFLRETYGPVLLEQKAARLRRETGNPLLRAAGKSHLPLKQLLVRAIQRPFRMLYRSPVILGVSLYMAMIYGVLYLLFVTFPVVFQQQYKFSVGIAGLCYLGIGVGMVLELWVIGKYDDSLVKRLSERHGKPKPEYRLLLLLPTIFATPIGLLVFGWSAQYRVHWIVPVIATGFVGVGITASFVSIQTYLIDAFTEYAASAQAANALIRSCAGGFLPLAGPALYSGLGLGWGNSLLALLSLLSGLFVIAIYVWGEQLREKYEVSFE